MSMDEAEAFFKTYDGHGQHMWGEDPAANARFEALKVPQETKERWRQEIVRDYLARLEAMERGKDPSDRKTYWMVVGSLISVLHDTKTGLDENSGALIEHLDRSFLGLDELSRIIILENLAGRNGFPRGSFIYRVCTGTRQGPRMASLLRKIVDFDCSDENDARFVFAVENVESALRNCGEELRGVRPV